MRIGLIAPSPSPFQIGGAERLFWGLQRHINRETAHVCELIKLPSPERDFREIVASYEAFFDLDVTHFDLIISGKYPAWMVAHDNHVVYMLHRLRGLYDAYSLMGLPLALPSSADPAADRFLRWLRRFEPGGAVPGRAEAQELFGRLRELLQGECDESLFRFPGPLSRAVIRLLDDAALAPDRIRKYAAISRSVRIRDAYFPAHADVQILYPPSDIEGLGPGSDDYLFTASRLDGPKRIDLVIDAMKHVRTDIPLLIAGAGPEEARLKERAAGDSRIRFLGFVSDREIASYYRDALAIPYVPLDEDYGLITIEAMMCGKPVVTVADAGGPNELVHDGETGYSVAPFAQAIGEKLEYLCSHRGEARTMGSAGRRIAEMITWDRVVDGLSDRPSAPISGKRRTKLTVVTTFPVHPPRGGGQSRVYHLYRHFAPRWDIDIVSFTGAGEPAFDGEIAPGVREIRVPKSAAHEHEERTLSEACNWLPVTDVAMPALHHLTPAYAEALHHAIRNSDVVVACHPYLVELIAPIAGDRPIWYEAQDMEIELKEEIFHRSAAPTLGLLKDTERVEARCWREAALVFACSGHDLERLRTRYGPTAAAMCVVPNGVATGDIHYVSGGARRELKQRLGVDQLKIALFMGSWHPPNLRAIEHVIALARSRPSVHFLVLGSAGTAFIDQLLPSNIGLLGPVDDTTKKVILSIADVALNPMDSGSGSNLKMLEYLAAGIPVASTSFGARGLEVRHGEHLHVAELREFGDAMDALLAMDEAAADDLTRRARLLVEADYDWGSIARRFQREVADSQIDPSEACAGPSVHTAQADTCTSMLTARRLLGSGHSMGKA